MWSAVFVNLADPGKCFIFFVSSLIRSRLFHEASLEGGFLRQEWDFWLGDIFNTCCVLGRALAFPALSLWLSWLKGAHCKWRFRPFPLRPEPCNACFSLLLLLPAQWTAVPKKSHYCCLLKQTLLLLSCK